MAYVRYTLRVVAGILVHAVVLFAGANSLMWREAWLVLAYLVLSGFSLALWLWRHGSGINPVLAMRRPYWSAYRKLFLVVALPIHVTLLIVPGIDAIRWQYSDVPEVVKAIAFGGLVISGIAMLRAIKETTFARAKNNGITASGPYGVVRHPLEAAGILFFATLPISLGSWLGLLPAAGLVILLVARVNIDEKMLRENVSEYQKYTSTVRYRLLPGIW